MNETMSKFLVCAIAFAVPLLLTVVLTPLVREMNRRLGLIDKPDARRINKIPIPRGGGVALFLGTCVPLALALLCWTDAPAWILPTETARFLKVMVLALAIVALGYADDHRGLKPIVKLIGQLVVAFLAWAWADLTFRDIWPTLPWWLDGALVIFWITGAVNAFNLIDGLDGLATGLALVATIGIAGSRFFACGMTGLLPYFVFAGGLLGFLRYNYNPASVFLGDSGSMFIGFSLASLALLSHTTDSFLVSVGVPILAMGVPVFDTFLAVLRRSLRHVLRKEGVLAGNDHVMTADTDHLHHRILRDENLNQRKTVWILYGFASVLVVLSFVAISLKSHAAGVWLVTFALIAVVAFRDMARVEIFDMGLILSEMARRQDFSQGARGGRARLTVPFYLALDVVILVAAVFVSLAVLGIDFRLPGFRLALCFRVGALLAALIFFKIYHIVWSRAVLSNFLVLLVASAFGAFAGSTLMFVAPTVSTAGLPARTILYALLSFLFLACSRSIRFVIRDLFYMLDMKRLMARKDVSRILVYGAGLRYQSFRRELIRSTARNHRVIVGLLDDNPLLFARYIGGLQVKGALKDVPELVQALNIDAVVVTFKMDDAQKRAIVDFLKPHGVKVTFFSFTETEI